MLGENQQRILYNYIGRGCAKCRQWRTDHLFAMPKAEANWQDEFTAVFVGKIFRKNTNLPVRSS
jgi:hypothetical protein